MNKKKVVAVLAAVAVVATLFVGCTTKKVEAPKTEAPKTEEAAKPAKTIGLSTDEGGLNDKSFNQSANEGVNKG